LIFANQELPNMDVIVPITKSSIFGMYTPVNEITLALSSEISDSPMVVEIIRLPSNTTYPAIEEVQL